MVIFPFPFFPIQTRGFSTFSVSPDGRRVCLMQQDLTTGFYTISVLEGGENALDPLSTATMEQASCCSRGGVRWGPSLFWVFGGAGGF